MRVVTLALFAGVLVACNTPDPIAPNSDAGAAADSGSPGQDTGVQPPADAGVPPGQDAAVQPGQDAAPTPVQDAGAPPVDDAGAPPVADGGVVPGDAGLPQGICGTRGGIRDCGAGAFCNFPIANNCGRTDRGGVCAWVPQMCTRQYAPVCGCDGQTYSNECHAFQAQASLDHRGSCEAGCGIFEGRQCNRGEFCQHNGQTCAPSAPGGICAQIPQACPNNIAPVCGCDGQTYGNECEARAAQQGVRHEGPCRDLPPPPPPPQGDGACGPPNAPIQCARTHYCNRPNGTCPEGNESTGGNCAPRPRVCNRMLAPVCGCDNHTYGNSCLANAAGTSVRHEGACR